MWRSAGRLGDSPYPTFVFQFCEWCDSPYISRFLSADTIVPGYANPQNLNRYSYVTNNPLRYVDPTGHRACGDGEDVDCGGVLNNPTGNAGNCSGASCGGNGSGGAGNGSNNGTTGAENGSGPDYKPCNALGINIAFCSLPASTLDGAALTLDTLALLISLLEAGTADAVILAAIGVSLFIPSAAPGLIPAALSFDPQLATALGAIENPLGIYSTAATALSDFLKGNTYVSGEGEYFVGGRTITSAATTALGFVPESNIDLGASAFIFGVDIGGVHLPASINVSTPMRTFLASFFPN